jgi:hypothetical protein
VSPTEQARDEVRIKPGTTAPMSLASGQDEPITAGGVPCVN